MVNFRQIVQLPEAIDPPQAPGFMDDTILDFKLPVQKENATGVDAYARKLSLWTLYKYLVQKFDDAYNDGLVVGISYDPSINLLQLRMRDGSTINEILPQVTDTTDGLMLAGDKKALDKAIDDIKELQRIGPIIPVPGNTLGFTNLFTGEETPTDLFNIHNSITGYDQPKDQTRMKSLYNGAIWTYFESLNEWSFNEGKIEIPIATSDTLGLVKSRENRDQPGDWGFVSVDNAGIMRVSGWDSIMRKVDDASSYKVFDDFSEAEAFSVANPDYVVIVQTGLNGNSSLTFTDGNNQSNDISYTPFGDDKIIEMQSLTINTPAGSIKYNPMTSGGAEITIPDMPVPPAVYDGTLTMQVDGVNVETFTANSSTNKTFNVAGKANQTDLNTEIAARQSDDSALSTRIDTEMAARIAADTALSTRIDTEASTRASADTALDSRIDTEASTRASADTALGNKIDANSTDITQLFNWVQGHGRVVLASLGGTTNQAQITSAFNGVYPGTINDKDTVIDLNNTGFEWMYSSGTWYNLTVQPLNNNYTDGGIVFSENGLGSVNGWAAVKNSLNANYVYGMSLSGAILTYNLRNLSTGIETNNFVTLPDSFTGVSYSGNLFTFTLAGGGTSTQYISIPAANVTGTLGDGQIASAATWNAKSNIPTAGAGISIGGTAPNVQITNTAPNVKSNWDAAAGNEAEILNKPTIPAGVDQNVALGTSTGTANSITGKSLPVSGQLADGNIASAATWSGKQNALPTTGTPATTYAVNISGNAATATTAGTANNLTNKGAVTNYTWYLSGSTLQEPGLYRVEDVIPANLNGIEPWGTLIVFNFTGTHEVQLYYPEGKNYYKWRSRWSNQVYNNDANGGRGWNTVYNQTPILNMPNLTDTTSYTGRVSALSWRINHTNQILTLNLDEHEVGDTVLVLCEGLYTSTNWTFEDSYVIAKTANYSLNVALGCPREGEVAFSLTIGKDRYGNKFPYVLSRINTLELPS